MKKPAFFLLFFLVAAPAFAQTGQQFGILLGGVKRMYSGHDRNAGQHNADDILQDIPVDRYRLAHGSRELFFAIPVEPSVLFKIQGGEWDTDVGIVQSGFDKEGNRIPNEAVKLPRKGKVRHVDGIIDYKFTEAFGTTGIFAGLGIYRWSAPPVPAGETAVEAAAHEIPTATNYGYTFGVNGEFPMTKRYAFMVEGAYHWINMPSPVRYVTLSGGLRVGF